MCAHNLCQAVDLRLRMTAGKVRWCSQLIRPEEKSLSDKTASDKTAKDCDLAAIFSRQDHEAPAAIAINGWRFHHLGIPTQTPREGERYLPGLKMYVSGFEASPYGIQWVRFDEDAPHPELVMTMPHIAFEVDD